MIIQMNSQTNQTTTINRQGQSQRDPATKGTKKRIWQLSKIENSSGGSDGELLIYGPIDDEIWWGDEVTPKDVNAELKALGEIENLNIKINSPGGSVWAGQAILSTLNRHPANKVVYIDGIAASAATVIAMAGDTIKMPHNATFMIHCAWGLQIGNADEFREAADLLDRVDGQISKLYEDKTGKTHDEIQKMMKAETWMNGQEALDHKFIDELEESKKVAASIRGNSAIINGLEFDINRFSNLKTLNIFSNLEQPDKPEPDNEPQQQPDNNKKVDNTNIQEEKIVMNLEQLKKDHPDLYNQIVNQSKEDGAKEERARLKAIDDLATIGHNDLVNKAKYDEPKTAQDLSFDILNAEKKTRQNYLNNTASDAKQLDDVATVDGGQSNQSKDEKRISLAKMMSDAANKLIR